MRRSIFLNACLVVLLFSTGLCFGQSFRDNRNVREFTRVNFGVAGDLFIKLGSKFDVVIEGNRNYVEDIITEVSGDRLTIKRDNWRRALNERVTIYITMPELEGLSVSGSGRAEVRDMIKGDGLRLSVSGSGKILTADVNVGTMDCSISGSGVIDLGGKGNISQADISISGSGDYNGESLVIEDLVVGVSGSGECICNVTGSLKANISGSGDVYYTGNPLLDARVSGSGHVRSR